MSLPGIGEDFSHLDMIIAELPELFYAEIFPKLDLKDTCNLARVNKAYNDAVWSVDGVRSMKAKMDTYNDLNPYRYPAFERIPHIHVAPIYWAVWHRNVPAGQGPPEVRGGREQTYSSEQRDPTVLRSL
jgi:hypothetical protein